MVVYEKIITLTAEEVEKCSRQSKAGNVRLITGKNILEIGQVAYTEILRNKLSEAVEGRGKFNFSDPPKSSGSKNVVFYVQCDHRKDIKKPMSVFYAKTEHRFGYPLQMKFNLVCGICEGIQEDNEMVENKNKRALNSRPDEENSRRNSEFKLAFRKVRYNFKCLLSTIKRECLLSPNPLKTLCDSAAKYGLDAETIMVDAIEKIQASTYDSSSSFLSEYVQNLEIGPAASPDTNINTTEFSPPLAAVSSGSFALPASTLIPNATVLSSSSTMTTSISSATPAIDSETWLQHKNLEPWNLEFRHQTWLQGQSNVENVHQPHHLQHWSSEQWHQYWNLECWDLIWYFETWNQLWSLESQHQQWNQERLNQRINQNSFASTSTNH